MNGQAEIERTLVVDWFENSYECSVCGASWVDEWSCTCNDHCPDCNAEIEPSESVDLSRPLTREDFKGAALIMFGSLRHIDRVTAFDAQRYGESMLEGGEHRFEEWLEECKLAKSRGIDYRKLYGADA